MSRRDKEWEKSTSYCGINVFTQCKEVFLMREATELLRYSLEDELKRIVNIIIEKCNPEKIILFGSMASGTAKEWSDTKSVYKLLRLS